MPGVPWQPQILADQLTLSQPGKADYAHQIILAPPRHTGLIDSKSFDKYAFKVSISLKTLKLCLLVLTKHFFNSHTYTQIFENERT